MRVKAILTECLGVLTVGLLFALVANQVSPRGLRLGRDYFGRSSPSVAQADGGVHGPSVADRPSIAPLPERWPEWSADEVLRALRDEGSHPGRVAFVDARKESVFTEGHIPGAHPLDRFYPETQLPQVVLAALSVEVVLVYCNGGTCEDSHYAAHQLVEAGVDRSKIRIFDGGFNEWTSRGGPIERGPRGGGRIEPPLP